MKEKCHNHPTRNALSFCHSCKRYFCEDCLIEGGDYYYCKNDKCQKPHQKTFNEKGQMARYPRMDFETFLKLNWRPCAMNTKYYEHSLRWECAECSSDNLFDSCTVFIEGTNMRLMLWCPSCGKPSIICIKGLFRTRIITEATVPYEVLEMLTDHDFPECKICRKETFMLGSLTNMILCDAKNTNDFNQRYGVRCISHSIELTEETAAKKGFSIKDMNLIMDKSREAMFLILIGGVQKHLAN